MICIWSVQGAKHLQACTITADGGHMEQPELRCVSPSFQSQLTASKIYIYTRYIYIFSVTSGLFSGVVDRICLDRRQ